VSRGGKNTKVHALINERIQLLNLILTGGNIHDSQPAIELFATLKFDSELYKQRNLVERFFQRIKNCGKPLHESNSHEFIVDENGNIHATNGGIVGKIVGSVITWYQNALNGRTILPKNIRCPTSLTHKKFARLIIEGGLFFVFYKPSH